MSLRTLLCSLANRHDADSPTHVLYFTPPGCPDYAAWYIVPVTDWCGDLLPRDWTFLGETRADAWLAEESCAGFAAEVLGFPVVLSRFEYVSPGSEIWTDGREIAPAYWLAPAGDDR